MAQFPLPSLVIVATVALGIGCKTAQHPNEPVVRKLELEGVKQVSESELRSKIATTETSKLTGWLPEWFPFADRRYFEPNAWRADVRRMKRFYEAHGFYDAKVVSTEVRDQNPNDVELKAVIVEGEPTRVQSLEVSGLDGLEEAQRKSVSREISIKSGDVFKEDAWTELKAKLRQTLRNLGYAEVAIAGTAHVETASHSAQLEVSVALGKRYRFGLISVTTGPDPAVSPDRIAEEARPAVKEGEWYSDEALANAQRRVSQLGVFGAVKVSRGPLDATDGVIPVVIDVAEAPFHTVRAGGGVGVDPIRQEARALAEYTDRNFLGGLRRLDINVRGGYALILFGNSPNSPFSSGPFYSVSAKFEQPGFLARDLRFTATLESSSNIQQAYRYLGGRAEVGVVWHPVRGLSLRPTYNFEAYRLWGESALLVSSGAAAPQLTYGCATPICNVFLSYLEQVIEYDRRDNPLEPHSGFYLSLSVQEGGGPLGGSFSYVRVMPDARYYQPLGSRFTLAVRARAGTLNPLANQYSPIVARFFAGGANSMRGFGTNRLSPMQAVAYPESVPSIAPGAPAGSVLGAAVPIGGNGLFEASIELRWEVIPNLILAVFGDAGMVTRDSFGGWPRAVQGPPTPSPYFQNMMYAVGVGLRYVTPIGPIRIDLAHRLPIGPGLEVIQPNGQTVAYPRQGTCFGIGDRGQFFPGSPEGPCAFHISVGEAF